MKQYEANGKEITLYAARNDDRPLIVLNNYSGNGSSVMQKLRQLDCVDFNLLCVGNLDWSHDMTPWYCPPLSNYDTPCTGGADEYLQLLLSEILPQAEEMVRGEFPYIGIAGYSLAGLFALYALYNCDVFARAASMSGSLWFPDFKEYCANHSMKRKPDKLYFSLGDQEAKTDNKFLRTVQEHTEAMIDHCRGLGIEVSWELNPGNHFKDAAMRSAKGIMAIL